MTRLRIIGLALVAMFALGGLATATASAEEGFLPLNMKHFNILAKKVTMENAAKESIKCNEVKGEGKFEKDSHGTGTLDFLECEFGGFIVWSLGEKVPNTIKEALILMPVLFLICLINSTTLLFGIFFELRAPVHVDNTSIGILTILEGAFIGDILGVSGKLFIIHIIGKEGKQEVTECKDEKGGIKKHSLTDTNAKGEKVTVSLNVEKETFLIQFLEAQELMDK